MEKENGTLLKGSLGNVAEFTEAFGLPRGSIPTMPQPDSQVRARLNMYAKKMAMLADQIHEDAAIYRENPGSILLLRLQLVLEEASELAQAFVESDLIEALDALCDMRYVADGTTLTLGLHGVFDDAFAEVHRSNMTKLDTEGKPVRNKAGRVVKSDQYEPPRLKELLFLPAHKEIGCSGMLGWKHQPVVMESAVQCGRCGEVRGDIDKWSWKDAS